MENADYRAKKSSSPAVNSNSKITSWETLASFLSGRASGLNWASPYLIKRTKGVVLSRFEFCRQGMGGLDWSPRLSRQTFGEEIKFYLNFAFFRPYFGLRRACVWEE